MPRASVSRWNACATEVLERLLIHRRPCALSLDKLAAVALVPWSDQLDTVFDE
jgi:hypothetical protein